MVLTLIFSITISAEDTPLRNYKDEVLLTKVIDGVIYSLKNMELHRSKDQGISFEKIDLNGKKPTSLAIQSNKIFIGTEDKIFTTYLIEAKI